MPPAHRAHAQEHSTVLNYVSIGHQSPHGLIAIAPVMWLALRSACGLPFASTRPATHL